MVFQKQLDKLYENGLMMRSWETYPLDPKTRVLCQSQKVEFYKIILNKISNNKINVSVYFGPRLQTVSFPFWMPPAGSCFVNDVSND